MAIICTTIALDLNQNSFDAFVKEKVKHVQEKVTFINCNPHP